MKLLALDSNSIINRAFYGIKLLTTKNGEYTNAVYGFINILLKLLDEVKPDAVACAFDLKAPTFRHKMYDGYKAQRKGMPEELAKQMPLVKELLTAMGYKIISLEGYEADDILGTLAKSWSDRGDSCVIATGDRDSLQLVGNGVEVLLASTKAGKAESTIYNHQVIVEKYGVTPNQLIDVKALMGDTSDNIPGVPGVGEKTALALISELGSLDGVYADIDNPIIKKGAREKLINNKDLAYMSKDLATINCQVPIETDVSSYVVAEGDKGAVVAMLQRLEMFNTIKRLGLEGVTASASGAVTTVDTPQIEAVTPTVKAFTSECLQGEEDLYLSLELDSRELPISFSLLVGDTVYSSNLDVNGQLMEIMAHSGRVITNFSKGLYHVMLQNGVKPTTVAFDTAVAGYVLSPSSNDYSPKRLSEEYGSNMAYNTISDSENDPAYLQGIYKLLSDMINDQSMKELYYNIELPLTQVLASMEHNGFMLDIEGITSYGRGIDSKITALTTAIYEYAGDTFNINSPKQLGEVLFVKLGLPTGKKTKSGYSTNADVLDFLKDKHPIIPAILEYRTLSKLKSTYVDGLLKVVEEDGKIHTNFKQTETRTGRISSTEPNMQNIPVRTPLGAELRKFFVAEEGMTLVDADYSQIELRVLADMSGDENMCEAFVNEQDIHTNTAAQVFNLPPLFITPEMRSRAKAVNFGIVYGIGAFSLSGDIGVSVAEAKEYIKNYLATYQGVKNYMDKTIEQGTELGYVSTTFGRRRYLPELKSSNKIQKAFGERVAMNMPIQGTAADIIKIAMIKVHSRLESENLKAKLILQVHDELIVTCPIEEAELVQKLVEQEMVSAAELKVPLVAEAKIGKNWYEAK